LNSLGHSAQDAAFFKINVVLVRGAVGGAELILLAVGLSLAFGVAGILNISHGSAAMLAAYFFVVFAAEVFRIGILPAIVVSSILASLIALVTFRLTAYPLIGFRPAAVMVTASAGWILDRGITMTLGSRARALPSIVSGAVTVGVLKVTYSEILSVGVSLGLFGVFAIFLKYAKTGKAMSAVSEDRETASLMGISVGRIYSVTIVIAALLAAVSGIIVTGSTTGTVTSDIWATSLTAALPIVVLGGMGSVKGTFVAAFIVSYADIIFTQVSPALVYIRGAVGMIIMVTILLVRPKGLFGKRVEME
jgi:branched-chain amino acid transport system permease protein